MEQGGEAGRVADVDEADLPDGSVSLHVTASSLNYKDALGITGTAPIARSFPMVAGIDLAGVVTASDHPGYTEGDEVVATGQGLGETHWGGLAERARLDGDWLVPLAPPLSPRPARASGHRGVP